MCEIGDQNFDVADGFVNHRIGASLHVDATPGIKRRIMLANIDASKGKSNT